MSYVWIEADSNWFSVRIQLAIKTRGEATDMGVDDVSRRAHVNLNVVGVSEC